MIPADTLACKWLAGFDDMNEPCLIDAKNKVSGMMAEILSDSPARWVALCGHSGTGKTLLARLLGRFMRLRGMFYNCPVSGAQLVRRWSWWGEDELARSLRDGAHHLIDDICRQWLVVLDDLGSTSDNTGFITNCIGEILNRRAGKWTLITTNRTVEKWAEIDHRIASRLLRDENVVVKHTCQDYALRRRAA
jgi:hypothetical protein